MGTEHILIGLLLEAEGVAAQTLGDVGVTVDKVREKLTELRGANDADPSSSPPFTSRSKKVLEYSLR
jgi:ATP-dependent Clp protease ATP-binding subunit ClpC